MTWRDYLTPDELARYDAIPAERRKLTREGSAIYERGRYLKAKHEGKAT